MQSQKMGVITEIERYAVKDGPGIRTVVFLKGCPLRCRWCANPETQAASAQLMYGNKRCIGCKECIKICPKGALSWSSEGVVIDRERCALCGACVKRCNSEALTMAGMKRTVRELEEEILKDAPFYRQSGGGVTFSGGEATAQGGIPSGAAADGQRARHPHGHRDLRLREMGDLRKNPAVYGSVLFRPEADG